MARKEKTNPIKPIYFYREDERPFGVFSNFFGRNNSNNFKLVLDNQCWPSVEHYFQAQKFLPTGAEISEAQRKYADAIREARTANIAKVLASQKVGGGYVWRTQLNSLIEQSLSDGVRLRSDWEETKDQVMLTALREKFRQNPRLRFILLSTLDCTLVENSPHDAYWGCGSRGDGHNKLGKLLMQVRKELLDEGAQ